MVIRQRQQFPFYIITAYESIKPYFPLSSTLIPDSDLVETDSCLDIVCLGNRPHAFVLYIPQICHFQIRRLCLGDRREGLPCHLVVGTWAGLDGGKLSAFFKGYIGDDICSIQVIYASVGDIFAVRIPDCIFSGLCSLAQVYSRDRRVERLSSGYFDIGTISGWML
jgi:hypothetical protein